MKEKEKELGTSGTPEEGKGGRNRSGAHMGHQRDTVGGETQLGSQQEQGCTEPM